MILAFSDGLIFAAFIVIAIAGLVVGLTLQAKRKKELAQWASAHNLRFDPTKDRGFDNYFCGFKCLQRGDSRYGYNICMGEWNGREITTFDYHYCTGSGKNRTTHTFSGTIIRAEYFLKPLYIRPEGFFDKVTEFFGYDDIDFESAEFSRKFYVKSSDKRWAYDVLHTRAMDYLLNNTKYHIQFEGKHIMLWWPSRKFKATNFEEAAGIATELINLLPNYVKNDLAEN